MDANISAILYLVSGVFFIMALRGLSSPETSRQGNYFGIVGMTIAVATTLLDPSIDMSNPSIIQLVVAGIVIGGVIGSNCQTHIHDSDASTCSGLPLFGWSCGCSRGLGCLSGTGKLWYRARRVY